MKRAEVVRAAAELVGNKGAQGELTVDVYVKRRYPRLEKRNPRAYYTLLRDIQEEATRQGLLDEQGKREGAR
jgi:hypothetical protein